MSTVPDREYPSHSMSSDERAHRDRRTGRPGRLRGPCAQFGSPPAVFRDAGMERAPSPRLEPCLERCGNLCHALTLSSKSPAWQIPRHSRRLHLFGRPGRLLAEQSCASSHPCAALGYAQVHNAGMRGLHMPRDPQAGDNRDGIQNRAQWPYHRSFSNSIAVRIRTSTFDIA